MRLDGVAHVRPLPAWHRHCPGSHFALPRVNPGTGYPIFSSTPPQAPARPSPSSAARRARCCCHQACASPSFCHRVAAISFISLGFPALRPASRISFSFTLIPFGSCRESPSLSTILFSFPALAIFAKPSNSTIACACSTVTRSDRTLRTARVFLLAASSLVCLSITPERQNTD